MKRSVLLLSLLLPLIFMNSCSPDEKKGVYSSGQVTIRGTRGCDLDLGVEATDHAQADFDWKNLPANYLQPVNGARFSQVGNVDFDSLDYDTLRGTSYSTNFIGASMLPVGTVIAFSSNQDRYGKFRIAALGNDLTITWVTYEH